MEFEKVYMYIFIYINTYVYMYIYLIYTIYIPNLNLMYGIIYRL